MTLLLGVSGPARAAASAGLALLLLLTGCSGGEETDDAGPPSSDIPSAGSSGPTSESPSPVPAEPGRLVSSEPYDEVGEDVRAWRVRYTTTDADGDPREATGLVVAPADPERRRALMTVAHPTVGIAGSCAPSSPERAPLALRVLTAVAQQGYVTVAPDYAGLGTPDDHDYLVGRAAAHDVLDAARSARELVPEAGEATLLWGHSQGGHAVLWAGQEASSYAPEVQVAGVAATGAPTDLRALVRRLEDVPAATLVSAFVVASWAREYPDARILELVPEESRPLLEEVADGCLGGPGSADLMRLARSLRGRLLPDRAYEGRLGELLADNSPSGEMEAPLLVGQGTRDEIVPRELTRAWVDRLCATGKAVDYREYPGGHAALVGSPALARDLLRWAEARVRGEPAAGNCG